MVACTPPTLLEFRARFPEFVDVEDAVVNLAIADAACMIDGGWRATPCADCTIAISFLAAHYLALGVLAQSGFSFVAGAGDVSSVKFETMSVQFSTTGGRWASGSYGFDDTPYGVRYRMLLRANFPAVMII